MKSVTLLQIGDVHLPDYRHELVGDIKDRAVPPALLASIAPQKLTLVIRNVLEAVDRHNVAGVLICGDLTSRGSLVDYDECVKYLTEALDLANPARWAADALHAVPGNHDVDRALCDPAGRDLFAKFASLEKRWSDIGLPILATNVIRQTSVSNQGGIALFSVNSCIGCGERRLLPEGVRDEIRDVLDRYVASATPRDAFDLVGEQLDTPAFDHEHVEALMRAITRLDDTWVPVVVAHHNILPQATPRVALYTEVVNGGLVRSRLTACDRPVVYCHGHIHDDPIELVQDQRKRTGHFISISAPELIRGFNIITIHFNRRHLPLGCEILCYRLQNDGAVVMSPPIRVPLVTGTALVKYHDEALQAVLRSTTNAPLMRFEEVRAAINQGRTPTLTRPTIKDALMEAEWLGLIDITNRNETYEHWQVRRREP